MRSVAKAFGGNQVLADVNVQIAPGEIVGLLGPNGSGNHAAQQRTRAMAEEFGR